MSDAPANGQGSVEFELPSGSDPSLIGIDFSLAYVVLGTQAGVLPRKGMSVVPAPIFVSDVVTIEITP